MQTERTNVDGLKRAFKTFAFVACLGLMQTLTSPLAHSADEDFADGLEAFDAGELDETVRIWTALADAGHVDAHVGLAGLYLSGSGVARDPTKAAELYRFAAERGHLDGQLNLGRLHLDGIGVTRDLAAAYAWLSLAAQKGRRWAVEKSEEIEPTLSDDQRTEAQKLIAAFQ